VNVTRIPKEDHIPMEQVAAIKKGWSCIRPCWMQFYPSIEIFIYNYIFQIQCNDIVPMQFVICNSSVPVALSVSLWWDWASLVTMHELLSWGKPLFSMGLENFIEIEPKTGIQSCTSGVYEELILHIVLKVLLTEGTAVYKTPFQVTFSTQIRSLTTLLCYSILPHPLQQVLVEHDLTFLSTWMLHLLELLQWLLVHFPDTIPNILPLIPLYCIICQPTTFDMSVMHKA
jgi:hypothetical protein